MELHRAEMSALPIVRINHATRDELIALHGIGPALADRIIAYRDAHGPFHGAADLSKVKGVPLNLAVTLANQIEWTSHSDEVTATKGRSQSPGMWLVFAATMMVLGLLLVWAAKHFVDVTLPSFERGWVPGALNVSRSLIGFTAVIVVAIGITRAMVYGVDTITGAVSLRVISTILLVLVSVEILSYIIQAVAYFRGVAVTFDTRQILTYLPRHCATMVLAAALLSLLSGRRSKRAVQVVIGALYAFALIFLITLPLEYAGGMGLLDIVLAVAGGSVSVSLAILGLQRDEPPLASLLSMLAELAHLADNADRPHWSTWINAFVPDPADQRQLLQALQAMHPPSKSRTILNVLFLSVGGWLLLTVFSTVIQYVIEHWLDLLRLFG